MTEDETRLDEDETKTWQIKIRTHDERLEPLPEIHGPEGGVELSWVIIHIAERGTEHGKSMEWYHTTEEKNYCQDQPSPSSSSAGWLS